MKRLMAALALGLSASGLAACGPGAPQLKIENAEYRAPLGTSEIGVAYFSITSAIADRIVGISSPQANSIEMHASVTEGAGTSMKRLDAVALPAGKTVTFGPKGMHLMIFTPKPLAAGATFPIQIALQSGRIETVPFHPALSQR